MSKKVKYIGRMRHKLDKNTKTLLYKSIVAPHLDYCSSILYLNNDGEIEKLQKIQNRALRIILNARQRTPITDMLNQVNVMSVKQKIYLNVLILMYKIKTKMVPNYLSKMLTKRSELQPYNLRSNELYNVEKKYKESARNSLFYKGTIMLNDFLQKYKCESIFTKDIKKMEEYIIKNY